MTSYEAEAGNFCSLLTHTHIKGTLRRHRLTVNKRQSQDSNLVLTPGPTKQPYTETIRQLVGLQWTFEVFLPMADSIPMSSIKHHTPWVSKNFPGLWFARNRWVNHTVLLTSAPRRTNQKTKGRGLPKLFSRLCGPRWEAETLGCDPGWWTYLYLKPGLCLSEPQFSLGTPVPLQYNEIRDSANFVESLWGLNDIRDVTYVLGMVWPYKPTISAIYYDFQDPITALAPGRPAPNVTSIHL